MSAIPQREEQLNTDTEELLNAEKVEVCDDILKDSYDEKAEMPQADANTALVSAWNRTVGFLDTIGQKAVYTLLALYFCVFTFYSFKYTEYFKSYENEYLEAHFDKSLKNVVFFFGFLAFCKLIYSGIHRIKGKLKGSEIALYVLCAMTFFVSMLWVKLSGSTPYGDQAFICNAAAEFASGTYDCMSRGGYIGMFSHQLRLTCILEIIYRLFGVGNYRVFQYFNGCHLVLLVWGGYKLVETLFKKEECKVYYLVLMTLCLPVLILYVPYIYGEMGSITWMVLSIWKLLEGIKKSEQRAFIYAVLFAFLAVFFRKNAIIFVIAEGIVLLFESLKQRRIKYLYVIIAMVVTITIGQSAIIKFYESRAGIQLGKGVPTISFVAMGMQDGWPGPGWYNNYIKEVYQQANLDADVATELSKANLKERLFHLNANKPAAIEFIKNKLKTQWNEPTYQAFWSNYSYDKGISNIELVEKVFNGNVGDILTKSMNFTQLAVYTLFTVSMTVMLVQKRRMCDCLPAITILGGLLFTVIWEAKGRYVLPYYVLMIIYAAYGIYCIHQMVERLIGNYFISRPEMLDAARIDRDKSLDDATLGGFDDRRDEDKPKKARIVLFTRRK